MNPPYSDISISQLYFNELEGLVKYGYKIEVPINKVFKWKEETLIATKQINGITIKIYIIPMPSHFWKIIIPTCVEQTCKITTGSGSIDEFLEKLEPIIPLIINDMIGIDYYDTPKRVK